MERPNKIFFRRTSRKLQSIAATSSFSMIELLVVAAILSILAAIAFPVFQSLKRTGYAVVCSNNLRQIGVSTMMYVSDHQGRLPAPYGYMGWPPSRASSYVGDPERDIQYVLAGYLGGTNKIDSGVWVCPLARPFGFPNRALFKFGAPAGWGYRHDITYRWNAERTTGGNQSSVDDISDANTPLTMARRPSQAAILWDVPDSGATPHQEGRVDCLFLDGHVSRIETGPVDASIPGTLWWHTSGDTGKGWEGWMDR